MNDKTKALETLDFISQLYLRLYETRHGRRGAFEQIEIIRRALTNERGMLEALIDPRCWADVERLPGGWWGIKAYTNGKKLVVCGVPDTDDESHNCDQMGCGSVGDHVLHIINLAAAEPGETEKE